MSATGSKGSINRRDFLKMSGLAAGTMALLPPFGVFPAPDSPQIPLVGQGRVTIAAIYRYKEPSFKSDRTGISKRDEILNIYAEFDAPDGPIYNPRWYQLADSFVHSAYLQRVENAAPHKQPLSSIHPDGQLGEVCVPYTRVYRKLRPGRFVPLYRLYYRSVHWITGIEEGPDLRPWYRLTDELLHVHYLAPTGHIRPIQAEELAPISPLVPPEAKRIEVSLSEQFLTAYEDDQIVYSASIASGVPTKDQAPGELPTDTPRGRFHIQSKMPSKHMGDGKLTDDISAYELPGVPWTCFFHATGVAFHGTYWHNNFGIRMSHGCVNMRNEDAKWLYRWTNPEAGPTDWYRRALGTLVTIT